MSDVDSPGVDEEEVQEQSLIHSDGFAPGFAG